MLFAAAAAAAANAVKSAPEIPSLPRPPSLPNPTEALKSSSDAVSNLSLPDAPSLTSVAQDSTALQQVSHMHQSLLQKVRLIVAQSSCIWCIVFCSAQVGTMTVWAFAA